jgi:predicted RNase H-like nuclease (RuvC/YqgF family)
VESDIFNKMELANVPKLDLSYTTNLASGIQAQIEESNKRTQQIAEEAYNNRQRMQKAIEQTATNTAETNVQLQKVVENQNAYIDVLKDQLSTQKQQLELNEHQLTVLKNIFASGEDGVAIEKEIMKLIQEQIDSNHPLWDYVKDKGGDIAVAGVTAGAPIIYGAIKMYLVSKGILAP